MTPGLSRSFCKLQRQDAGEEAEEGDRVVLGLLDEVGHDIVATGLLCGSENGVLEQSGPLVRRPRPAPCNLGPSCLKTILLEDHST